MDTLYHQTNKLVQQTQECFQLLESRPINYQEIESNIQEKISLINSNCEKLDTLLFKVPIAQRQNAKMNCDQLKYDSRHLQAALTSWQQKRVRKQIAASEREQLLGQRFTSNPELTTINIDYALQHQNSLYNAHQGVDEMLQTGSGTLESLRSQRNTLKGAHRRIVDMANTLGLSNHTMRLIEKRVLEDKYILVSEEIPAETVVSLTEKQLEIIEMKKCQEQRILKMFIGHLLDPIKVKLSNERENYYNVGRMIFRKIHIRGIITGINVIYKKTETYIFSVDDGTATLDCFLIRNDELEDLRIRVQTAVDENMLLVKDKRDNMDYRAALMMLRSSKEKLKKFMSHTDFNLGDTVEVIGKLQDYKKRRSCFVKQICKVNPIYNVDYYEELDNMYKTVYARDMLSK
ncbi:hypothetical protein FQR65_LT02708 [Abscondita terminalis]|nr:hypothetical protein FQR65_LT02708 [Abscondita terminalis]